MNARPARPAHRAQGFSLVELMVAMVLSLIIISAVIGVFAANQQTSRAQTDLNNAQEAFRFASHTIKRVVRQGAEIDIPASGEWLRVVIKPKGENGYKDCLGREITIETTNTFSIVDGNLRCSAANADGTLTETIVGGLDASNSVVLFGQASDRYWTDNDQWKAPGAITDWEDVRSVNVSLAMLDGQGESHGRVGRFSATMRMPVLAATSVAGGAGGVPGGGSGSGGGSNGDDDGDDDGSGDDGDDDNGGGNDDDGDHGDGGSGPGDDDDEETGGDEGGSGPVDDPPSPGICKCFFQNKQQGYRLLDDSANDAACSVQCCRDNDPGVNNNQSFTILAEDC